MATKKSSDPSTASFSELGTDERALVERRFNALAEINRQRAKAVEAHFDLVRRGVIDLKDMSPCW